MYYFIDIDEYALRNEDDAFTYHSGSKKYDAIIEDRELQYEHTLFPLSIMGEGLYEIEHWFKEFDGYWEKELQEVSTDDYEWEEQEDGETLNEYQLRIQRYLESSRKIKALIDDLLDNYEISYVSLSKNIEIGKVCEIFTHINQRGGVKLDTFDLLNAITRPKNIQLKQMYREASTQLDDREYPGFEIKSYILMVMSMFEQNYCSPKYLYSMVPGAIKTIKEKDGTTREITLIHTAEEFINKWDNAVTAIESGLNALKNPREFGAIRSRFLPYPSLVPALSAIRHYVKTQNISNKASAQIKIMKWYWASIFLNRYSSSVESTSTRDFMQLKEWLENDDKELDCIDDVKREYTNLDLHRETRSNSAIYKAIFCLFVLNEARDWETFNLPEYDNLDDHHIVPKSWGGKRNGIGNMINSVLNRTAISPNTNRNIIKDRLPNVYIKSMIEANSKDEVYQTLESHLISSKATDILLRDPFTKEDYLEFIQERKTTILEQIKVKLLNQSKPLTKELKQLDQSVERVEIGIRHLILNAEFSKSFQDFKENMPSHILDKLATRLKREKKNNPALIEEHKENTSFWMQYSDLQELQGIITSKSLWSHFEDHFGSKEKFTSELNDIANLRNAIRHSREVDKITKLKGEASLMWFEEQLKISIE